MPSGITIGVAPSGGRTIRDSRARPCRRRHSSAGAVTAPGTPPSPDASSGTNHAPWRVYPGGTAISIARSHRIRHSSDERYSPSIWADRVRRARVNAGISSTLRYPATLTPGAGRTSPTGRSPSEDIGVVGSHRWTVRSSIPPVQTPLSMHRDTPAAGAPSAGSVLPWGSESPVAAPTRPVTARRRR